MQIPRLTIDCNDYLGRMCRLAGAVGSDRSVRNEFLAEGARKPHRHAYTPVYELLFASRRLCPLRIAELGIAVGAGLRLLRAYFPAARLIGFERDESNIRACRALDLPGVELLSMDVSEPASIAAGFESAKAPFDIVIDDSSHRPEDQVRVVLGAYPFLAPGGTLIVEDIFEDAPEAIFADVVARLEPAFAAFLLPQHRQLSRGWKNDKLLVLTRGDEPRELLL